MPTVPRNPHHLKSAELRKVKSELLAILTDPNVEPRDRIAAAKELNRLYETISRLGTATSAPAPASTPASPDCPLQGLRIVG